MQLGPQQPATKSSLLIQITTGRAWTFRGSLEVPTRPAEASDSLKIASESRHAAAGTRNAWPRCIASLVVQCEIAELMRMRFGAQPEHCCTESSRSKNSRKSLICRQVDDAERITATGIIVNNFKLHVGTSPWIKIGGNVCKEQAIGKDNSRQITGYATIVAIVTRRTLFAKLTKRSRIRPAQGRAQNCSAVRSIPARNRASQGIHENYLSAGKVMSLDDAEPRSESLRAALW
jgi:hypothetical protein